jgi:IS605 OrfB family transposase
MTTKKTIFTYQTRLKIGNADEEILDDYATVFGTVERSLFGDYSAGENQLKLKNDYLKRFGITARQFNACRIQLAGKIDSNNKLQPLLIANLSDRIESLKHKIEKLSGKKEAQKIHHQKKRRLVTLQHRLQKLKSDHDLGKVHLCFGGKKLFRSQFFLEKNGYQSHDEWKKEWHSARNSEFFVLGSKDETAGNQSCTATINEDETLNLRLRLPPALFEKHGKHLEIPNVCFSYGQETILVSLRSCLERKLITENKADFGRAISYRFKKDKKGWKIFVSTEYEKQPIITDEKLGSIGLDINANHLALVEIDRFGNPLKKKSISLNTYGKNKNQALAEIGRVSAEIIAWAEKVQKPIVLENLDFKKKKATLKEENTRKNARMLSSLSYTQTIQMLKAKAYRKGVVIYTVNPAYTSIIGQVKFAKRYGLTKHHAAALCIARRKYGYSEQPPKSCIILDGKNDQYTLPLPVRNRGRHVWTFWATAGKKIRAAHAAHLRSKTSRSTDSSKADLCDKESRSMLAKSQHANR